MVMPIPLAGVFYLSLTEEHVDLICALIDQMQIDICKAANSPRIKVEAKNETRDLHLDSRSSEVLTTTSDSKPWRTTPKAHSPGS